MFLVKLSWDLSRLLILVVKWDVLCSCRVYHCALSGCKKVMLWFLFVFFEWLWTGKKHNEAFIFDWLIDDTACVHHCHRIWDFSRLPFPFPKEI